MYSPFKYIKISRERPNENLFYYLYLLNTKQSLNFIIEDKPPTGNEILMLNEDSYVCTKCDSPIEILSINKYDDEICFKCIKVRREVSD